MMDYNKIILDILKLMGGISNIESHKNCMTRLRLTLKDISKVKIKSLEGLEYLFAVKKYGDQLQLIFGPGKAEKVQNALNEIIINSEEFNNIILENKNKIKSKRTSRFQEFMAKFSNIFIPLIPGFIAAGMLAGLGGLFNELNIDGYWIAYIDVFNKSLTQFMYIMIGYNASVAFGGTGVIGGILSGFFLITYGDAGTSGLSEFFGIPIDPRGGMIGILFVTIIGAKVEQLIRKRFSWEVTDIITTPILTLLITGAINYTIIMPTSYQLFEIMNYAFAHFNGNPIGGGILSGLFLPSVMLGVHQGFVPVYQGLIRTIGINTLFPLLAMAGAGQVGAGIALYLKSPKNSKLRKSIRGAIVPGILGIGEPLIYGVTLPRVKPFFTSMLGGATGGVYIGIMAKLGFVFGLNTVFGPSGILASFEMTSNRGIIFAILLYISALLVAYTSGFIFTYLFGCKNVDLS